MSPRLLSLRLLNIGAVGSPPTLALPRNQGGDFKTVLWLGITLFMLAWPGTAMAADVARPPAQPIPLEEVRENLRLLDEDVMQRDYDHASAIIGKSIKARSLYRNYLQQAAAITEELFYIRERLDEEGRTLSLQQLSGLAYHLHISNMRFKGSFGHGEEQFRTYQLIQKAVDCLDDAVAYWRVANEYRRFYRGGVRDRKEDAELVETRVQTALNAIDELKIIVDTRKVLNRQLEEDD